VVVQISSYFVVVSLATVGYGDIAPITVPGKVIVILMILASLVVVPGLISSIAEALSLQKSGGGTYVKGASPFVVVLGLFDTVSKLLDVIESFVDEVRY
jgi:Flp pilus assembly protein protease CpaA